ncbi:hypothetical protein ACQEVB_11785 [Pseudonocardia sp. CA-107938]|uniref:hypothetical protein n=1 Tax=Pseudonocardia sp. CA-107938 TaxID=3240021 RepID=UPI003D8E62D6
MGAKHERQAANATYDNLRSRWFSSDREKCQALADEIADDPLVQRGVTVTRSVAFEQPGRIVGRRRARLVFETGDDR